MKITSADPPEPPDDQIPHKRNRSLRCPLCNDYLLRRDTRPSTIGENANVRIRLYGCPGCGKSILTEEAVLGPFAKKGLPKANAPRRRE